MRRNFAVAAAVWVACAAAHAAPPDTATATVGDPQNPAALAADLQAAYKNGVRTIVIRPGTYVLPNVGHTQFLLEGWKNTVIRASGVTFILTDLEWTHDAFSLSNCDNVTLDGPTIGQNVVPFYQGRVVEIGRGDNGNAYCDWKPDTGYPIPPADAKKFPSGMNVVDAKTRLFKIGVGDFYEMPMEATAGGVFRIHFREPDVKFAVGDFIVGRCGGAPFKVFLNRSRNCTLKNLTLMRNGFSPIREDLGGGNHLLNLFWTLGPKPSGATEPPLITNSADGFHSTGARPGPVIENCRFSGLFLDDCIAIHGGFQKIKSVSGKVLVIETPWTGLKVGDAARISGEKGFFGEAVIAEVKQSEDNTTTVTLDKDLGVPADAKWSAPAYAGAGYKIIGCFLGDTRSRGILVKGDNGLIRSNTIVRCGMSAISIGPEYYWNEADYVRGLMVENNTLRENGRAGFGGAAILVHGDGAMGNRDLVIRNNNLNASYQGDFSLEWTSGATIFGNTITGASPRPKEIGPPSVVFLRNCRDITLRDNFVYNAAAYKPALVEVGPDVENIKNNDTFGISAEPKAAAKAAKAK